MMQHEHKNIDDIQHQLIGIISDMQYIIDNKEKSYHLINALNALKAARHILIQRQKNYLQYSPSKVTNDGFTEEK